MEKFKLGDGYEPWPIPKPSFVQRDRLDDEKLVFPDKLGQNNGFSRKIGFSYDIMPKNGQICSGSIPPMPSGCGISSSLTGGGQIDQVGFSNNNAGKMDENWALIKQSRSDFADSGTLFMK